jgi:hypothetical protein
MLHDLVVSDLKQLPDSLLYACVHDLAMYPRSRREAYINLLRTWRYEKPFLSLMAEFLSYNFIGFVLEFANDIGLERFDRFGRELLRSRSGTTVMLGQHLVAVGFIMDFYVVPRLIHINSIERVERSFVA